MEIKEAVALAKTYVRDVFLDENITNIGLEEVEFDDGEWYVTIGFFRPWERDPQSVAQTIAGILPRNRDYKVVRITDSNKHIVSVKNRETTL